MKRLICLCLVLFFVGCSNEKGLMCYQEDNFDEPRCYLLIDADNKTVKGNGPCRVKDTTLSTGKNCDNVRKAGGNGCPEWYDFREKTISVTDSFIRFERYMLSREQLWLSVTNGYLYCRVEDAKEVKNLVRKKTREYERQRSSKNKI